ncbi:MAG: serine/threonine protein kinase [Acidobacteria bacterium]|jgi:serine/threonine protein kinase|nr:serine/threonine protein kinase [Acidobacteriota bacterium]
MREASASVLEPGTLFDERYRIVRKIGEGGMGIVYVATDTNTKDEIVLKLIHPSLVAGEEALDRLMSEGRTARQIRHANVVAVYDVSLCEGQAYFTMEYVKGGTLRSWMNAAKRSGNEVSVHTAAGLMKAMLAGVAEAHRLGFVHRDLKPENVLLDGDPDAGNFDLKILDFGIAKAVGAASATGGALGTPPYMAPEQNTSADSVGPTADFYSLSVMLYELLMEAPPLGRWEMVSTSRRDVPKAIDELLEKGLSARPRNRFASAAEFDGAIGAAVKGVRPTPVMPDPPPLPVPPPAPPGPPPTPPGPNVWQAYFTNMPARTKMWLGIGIAVLAVMAWMSDRPEEDLSGPEFNAVQPVDPNQGRGVQPASFNMSGVWLNDGGDRLDFRQDGTNVEGTGLVTGMGPVVIKGTFDGAVLRYVVYSTMNRQAIAEGGGQLQPDRRHINLDQMTYGFGRSAGQLHFDHLH